MKIGGGVYRANQTVITPKKTNMDTQNDGLENVFTGNLLPPKT